MMKEVLFRSFSKAIKEKSGSLSLPDLIMIDGGKGQYSVSREVLNELGLHDLPILAVAKGKKEMLEKKKFIIKVKNIFWSKNNPLLFFIQRLRDEAHRFAISTHRAKRRKNLSKSLLDQIQGIGKQRKRALLNHFGSARSVESASLDDLKSVDGIEDSIAKRYIIIFTSKTMKIKIPNILTIGRIIIVPIFVITFFFTGFFWRFNPIFLFVLASFTDFLDGLLARIYKEESKLGELLDPIADKILIAAALVFINNEWYYKKLRGYCRYNYNNKRDINIRFKRIFS